MTWPTKYRGPLCHSVRQNGSIPRSARSSLGRPDPLEIHGPVGFPRTAGVRREGLFPVGAGFRDCRPRKANANRTAIKHIVALKHSDAVYEAAAHRRVDRRRAPVDPPDVPGRARRVVRADRHGSIRARRQFDHVVVDVRAAVHQREGSRRSFERFPTRRTQQTAVEASMPHVPTAHEKIEITAAVGKFRFHRHL